MEGKPNEEKTEEVKDNETKTEKVKNEEAKVQNTNETKNNNVEKTVNTGFKKVEKKKKRNFGKLFFVIILLAGITAALWYFVYYQPSQNQNNNQESNVNNNQEVLPIDEAKTWEKTYSKILTDENNYKNYSNIQIQLIKINRLDQIPVMVVTYDSTRNPFEKILDVWKTDENGTSIERVDNCSTTDDSLKILYDINEGTYKWYIYNKTSEAEAYGDLERLLGNTKSTTNQIENDIFGLSKIGSFNFYDYVVSSNPLMGNIKKEQFEEKYIVINTKDLKDTWIDLKINEIDENEVLKAIINEEKLNKNASSVVSDIKDSIFAKADEILKKTKENNSNTNMQTDNQLQQNELQNSTTPNPTTQDTPIQGATTPNSPMQDSTTQGDSAQQNNIITPNTNPVIPDNSNNNQNAQANANNQPEVSDIGQQEALNIAKKIFGDESDGRKMSYTYIAWVNDANGKKYYAFRVAWLVNNDHYSFVDTLLISADGKSYKEIGTPEDFVDGQIVTKFDVEANV